LLRENTALKEELENKIRCHYGFVKESNNKNTKK